MAEGKGEEQERKIIRVLAIIAVISVAALAVGYFMNQPKVEKYSVSGVPVESELTLAEFQRMYYISLYNTTQSKAELTCKFELSAISSGDPRGYRIKIEEGETGIQLGRTSAVIRGRSDNELLKACHVFACMRDNLTCPQDFAALLWKVEGADSVGIVLDSSAGEEAGRTYAELMGVLGYMQAKHVDKNMDGIFSQDEINNNTFFIYPFLKVNDTCFMQPVHSLVQNLSGSNATYSCDLPDAIYLLPSEEENRLAVEGSKIILSGDGRRIHTAGVILRDSLDPEWILRVYNLQ
ncbi:MAG: hypothetical protein NTU61_05925 [Candidatus Altiarchaeota archaeon]|nr:hypothetical protein [Candidatus Altiarchaeota archaeon]